MNHARTGAAVVFLVISLTSGASKAFGAQDFELGMNHPLPLSLIVLLLGLLVLQTLRVTWRGRELRQKSQALADQLEYRKHTDLEMESLRKQLLNASHQAGLAEVATSVLHNVGNVLTSVNVSADLAADRVRGLKIADLPKLSTLLTDHASDPSFLTADPRGKVIPDYLTGLGTHLTHEQEAVLKELNTLQQHITHINDIVAMQQQYSRVAGTTENITLTEMIEDALRLNSGALMRHNVQLVRQYQEQGTVTVVKHRVLQILVNLIRNAKYAMDESGRQDRQLTIQTLRNGDRVQIKVIDNGIGIPPENLTRIFGQGFTTRKDGHGFGLHSSANAARELGGTLTAESAGKGQGACFTLEFPVDKSRQTRT